MQDRSPVIAWITPWAPLAKDIEPTALNGQPYAEWLVAELQREVCKRHVLYGIRTTPIGFNKNHSDEFLFATDHPDFPFAFVHLTWQVESDPKWPCTECFASEEHLATWMQEYHDSYLGGEA